MCLACDAEAVKICEVFGKWLLYKSTVDHEDWAKDSYGLLIVNDPEFVWKGEIVPDPYAGLIDEECDQKDKEDPIGMKEKSKRFDDAVIAFRDCISMDSHWMKHSYNLINSAKEAGYDPDNYNFERWFINFLSKKIVFQK